MSRESRFSRSAVPGVQAPPWPFVLAVTFLLGVFMGGLAVQLLFQDPPAARAAESAAQELSERDGAPGTPTAAGAELLAISPAPPAPPAQPAAAGSGAPGAGEAATGQEAPWSAEPPHHAPGSEEGAEPAPQDALLSLTAVDPEGARLPAVPAVLVGEGLVLAALSAVEATVSATVSGAGTGAPPRAVRGIVARDPALDLVLLELAGPGPADDFGARPLALRAAAVFDVEPAVTTAWRDGGATTGPCRIGPGPGDRFSGVPRLLLEPPAPAAGLVVDAASRLVALIPEAGPFALPVAGAAAWVHEAAARGTAPIPLEAHLRLHGAGSTEARLRRARQRAREERFDEAARILLELTAAEPARIEQVGPELALAVREAARGKIAAGQGDAARALLLEALHRLPRDAELLAVRGRADALLGDTTGAVEGLLGAAELLPPRAAAFRDEARGILLDQVNLLHMSGRTAAALDLLIALLPRFPTDGGLRLTAAELLLEAHRFREAVEHFSTAALLDAALAAEARRQAERARDLAGGPGDIVIDFAPGASEVVVEAVLEGGPRVRLRIDPQERLVVLPRAAALAAGHDLASARRTPYADDPWAPELPTIQIGSLAIAGIAAGRVTAVVDDGRGGAPGADGILGASFLERFRVVADHHLGRMVLRARTGAGAAPAAARPGD